MNIYLSADPKQHIPRKILQFPLVKGVRCNTGALMDDSKVSILNDFRRQVHPLTTWVDLKCRELRVMKEATVPHDYLEINHNFYVDTPTTLYYNEGKKYVIIDEIIGENKIAIKPPKNYRGSGTIRFGKGASINIPDPSLRIDGYFTSTDIEYIKAARQLGIHNYLLSYVESPKDIKGLLELDPEAKIIAKIESKRGLDFAKHKYHRVKDRVRLLAARADLYIELDRPHEILSALKLIIKRDPQAIAASRILESFLELREIPQCADICDLGYLMELGYQNFLLGDDLCQNEEALLSTLGLFNAISP